MQLPRGLLADASIDGGACLRSSTPMPAGQVGTGAVTATENVTRPIPLTLNASFDLVRPPKPGDLAGLALIVVNPVTGPAQLGSPGDITVRSSKDPAGVGLNIAFENIPNRFPVALGLTVPISVDSINTTLAGLRLPDTCPVTPARFTAMADSYNDASPVGASAPLHVTGCSTLPYKPHLRVTAVKDKADSGVAIVTDVTQAPADATSQTVALTLPSAVVMPNLAGVVQGGFLCTKLGEVQDDRVGERDIAAVPQDMTGKVYLTATLAGIAVTITFPSPFALTLRARPT